jgi:hypothetical protein
VRDRLTLAINHHRSRRLNAEHHSAERIEIQGLTYGEVDLFSFVKILRMAEARDNQVFVDLVGHFFFLVAHRLRVVGLGKQLSLRLYQELNSCDASVGAWSLLLSQNVRDRALAWAMCRGTEGSGTHQATY